MDIKQHRKPFTLAMICALALFHACCLIGCGKKPPSYRLPPLVSAQMPKEAADGRPELSVHFLAHEPNFRRSRQVRPFEAVSEGYRYTLSVGVSRDAYIYIFRLGEKDKARLIFPDRKQQRSDTFALSSEATLHFPHDFKGMSLFKGKDYEVLYIVASFEPIADMADFSYQIGAKISSKLTRYFKKGPTSPATKTADNAAIPKFSSEPEDERSSTPWSSLHRWLETNRPYDPEAVKPPMQRNPAFKGEEDPGKAYHVWLRKLSAEKIAATYRTEAEDGISVIDDYLSARQDLSHHLIFVSKIPEIDEGQVMDVEM